MENAPKPRVTFKTFAKPALITFVACTIISFTPLSLINEFGVIGLQDPGIFWIILLFLGAPFAGYFIQLHSDLLEGKPSRVFSNAVPITGFWVGFFAGSWFGVEVLQ
ncbi:MAG: hypothetical protein ACWA47_12575 [Brevirhabdus sp.]